MTRILVVQAHPDARDRHLCHALADAYADSAAEYGHQVRRIDLGRIKFPLLRSKREWTSGAPPEAIARAQESLLWAEHLLIVFPLWLGDMPAVLKGFLEQALRPGFAVAGEVGKNFRPLLAGKSARIVITTGMPAFVYRWFFGASALKILRRNIFALAGIRPVRSTLIGGVETTSAVKRDAWLERMRRDGAAAR